MKVLIPFSGGVNSTYGLWRWLNETDHEIHSYRHVEASEPEERKQITARNMVQWLKDNVRDFTFWEEEGIIGSFNAIDKELGAVQNPLQQIGDDIILPIRSGFRAMFTYKNLVPRWLKRIEIINRVQPDACLFGLSMELTNVDWASLRLPEIRDKFWNRENLSYYFIGNKVLDTPYPSAYFLDPADPDEWIREKWDAIARNLTGRFEQWEAIPAELKAMYEVPHIPRCDHTEKFCLVCLWQDVQERRTDLTGREKDLALAELGNYGPFRGNADPETQPVNAHLLANVQLVKDYLDWPEGISWT